MKRLLIPVVLLAGVVAVIAVNAAAKGKPAGPGGHTIQVIEHAITDRQPVLLARARAASQCHW